MSLKKIAEQCHTSVSTVSRVLNNSQHQCHDKKLAEQILKTAHELKYIPNPAAKELKLGISNSLSNITIDILPARFQALDNDYFFQELFQNIQNTIFQKQCLLGDILNIPDIQHRLKQGNFFMQSQKRGLIILGKCNPDLLNPIKEFYPNVIAVDRNPTNYALDEIVCDGKQAAIIAMEHLIQLGHKKIAYIGDCSYESRYMGYYEALISKNIPLNYQFIYATKQTYEEGIQVMQSIIRQANRPTAILCANDTTALGVLKELQKHSRSHYIPSVISIDNIHLSEQCSPMLTTVNIPKEEMGKLAVTILCDRIAGGHTENLRINLPCKLIQRESCFYCAGNR